MSRYTVIVREVYVVGVLWMGGKAAMTYKLTAYDVENIGKPLTREVVENWLGCHSGDFQQVLDFQVNIDKFYSDWATGEGEQLWGDCMDPVGDLPATPHFHAMSGEHGCLPDHNSYCLTVADAVDDLANVFDLGKRRRQELKRNWSLELRLSRDGAEYCEITECSEDCKAGDFE